MKFTKAQIQALIRHFNKPDMDPDNPDKWNPDKPKQRKGEGLTIIGPDGTSKGNLFTKKHKMDDNGNVFKEIDADGEVIKYTLAFDSETDHLRAQVGIVEFLASEEGAKRLLAHKFVQKGTAGDGFTDLSVPGKSSKTGKAKKVGRSKEEKKPFKNFINDLIKELFDVGERSFSVEGYVDKEKNKCIVPAWDLEHLHRVIKTYATKAENDNSILSFAGRSKEPAAMAVQRHEMTKILLGLKSETEKSLMDYTTELQERMEKQRVLHAILNDRVQGVERVLNNQGELIVTVIEAMDSVRSDVVNLKNQVIGLKTDLGIVKYDVEELKKHVDTRFEEQDARIGKLEKKMKDMQTTGKSAAAATTNPPPPAAVVLCIANLLSYELSEDDHEEYEIILKKARRKKNPGSPIRSNPPVVSAAEILRIAGEHKKDGKWLGDQGIHAFFKGLCKEKGGVFQLCHGFSTFFLAKVFEDGIEDFSKVEKWALKVEGGDIFKYEVVFFPYNFCGSHWNLIAVFMRQKKIIGYDSMGGGCRQEMKLINRFLQHMHEELYNKPMRAFENFDTSDSDVVPRQSNGYDCGVFICLYAHCLKYHGVVNENLFNQQAIYDKKVRERLVLAIHNM